MLPPRPPTWTDRQRTVILRQTAEALEYSADRLRRLHRQGKNPRPTSIGGRKPGRPTAASAGVDGVTLPERDIRRPLPAAKAEKVIGAFHANRSVGALMRGVQFARPDQRAEVQRGLDSGQ